MVEIEDVENKSGIYIMQKIDLEPCGREKAE